MAATVTRWFVARLLLQLDETAGNFDTFWMRHRHRLEQCLQLRHFEEQFKQVNTSPFQRRCVESSVMGSCVFSGWTLVTF